jgi:hypothetical protein
MEEGKPNRVRVITTKKRAFKDHDYVREDQSARPFVFEREAKQKTTTRPRMTKTEITDPKAIKRKIRISEAFWWSWPNAWGSSLPRSSKNSSNWG